MKKIFCKYCFKRIKENSNLNENSIYINLYNEKICFDCLII